MNVVYYKENDYHCQYKNTKIMLIYLSSFTFNDYKYLNNQLTNQ